MLRRVNALREKRLSKLLNDWRNQRPVRVLC